MARHVKGILFADYVRMIRGQKSIDWKRHLEDEDLTFLVQRVDPAGWYPMQTFERMGNAILKEIAAGDVEAARMWGRVSVDQLRLATPSLLAERDPLETLMRFKVLRSTFFDFEAVEVTTAASDHAAVRLHYHMGAMAEEAASFQTMGFFERLLVIAEAEGVDARFTQRSWAGEARTVLELHWDPPT
ncbi:MAG: hypothetical protein KF850_11995 [Labilithrix sp.]|nr:hypothetical protein [Labilithrix sp.]